MTLNLTANGAEQTVIKAYLEQNASDILAEKINNGVTVEQDGKTLINRKTLDGFLKYAAEEARKQAEKGATSACIQDSVVFGWAIHYFEEESIIGTLYNEDGSEYQKPKSAPKATPKKTTGDTVAAPIITKAKAPVGQMSMFDFMAESAEGTDTAGNTIEEPASVVITDTEEEAIPVVKPPEKPSVLPLYAKYLQHQEEFPQTVVAMKVGDFYEIFGESAKLVAEQLNMTLTSRDVGLESRVPMVGYPYHKEETYRELIRKFSHLAVISGDNDMQFYPKAELAPLTIDAQTGEVIEEAPEVIKTEIGSEPDPYADMELMYQIYELLDRKIDIVR